MKSNGINTIGLTSLKKDAYGADFAKVIREELKRRGVKGVSVRAKRSGWTDAITVTVKMDQTDFATVDEAAERYSLKEFCWDWERYGVYFDGTWHYGEELMAANQGTRARAHRLYIVGAIKRADEFHENLTREQNFELSTPGYERLLAIFRIANQWNWNRSDSQTDYFDVGYYLHIRMKKPENFTVTA